MLTFLKSKKNFRNVNLYFTSSLVNAGIAFLLMQVLTKKLSIEEYAIITLFTTFSYCATVLINFNFTVGLERQFFNKDIDFAAYLGNCLFLGTGIAGLLAVVLYIGGELIAAYVNFPLMWLYVAVIVGYGSFLATLFSTIAKLEQIIAYYSLVQMGISLLGYLLTIVAVVFLLLGWQGRLLAVLVSSVVPGLVCLAVLIYRGKMRFSINRQYITDLMIFGLPLLPLSISNFTIASVDKLIISSKVGLDELGIYSVAFQVASIVPMVVTAIANVWVVWVYSRMEDPEKHGTITQGIYLIGFFLTVFSVILALCSPFIIDLITTREYSRASTYVMLLAMANVFGGMVTIIGFPSLYYRKTWNLTIIMCSAAMIDLLLTYLFVNLFGAIGAAQALFVSNFFLLLLCIHINGKLFSYNWLGKRSETENSESLIVANYEKYDRFLAWLAQKEKSDRVYLAFQSVRCAYAVDINMPGTWSLIKRWVLTGILVFLAPFLHFRLSDRQSQVVIFNTGSIVHRERLAKIMNLPLVTVEHSFGIKNFKGKLPISKEFLLIIYYCLVNHLLETGKILSYAYYMLGFLAIYDNLDFGRVTTIITETDISPKEFAVVKSARNKKLRTIKIDYVFTDPVHHNSIYCQEYFCPNEYHKEILGQFPQNRDVIFHHGGFPSWDELAKFTWEPANNEKIITYFTQHTYYLEQQMEHLRHLADFVDKNPGYTLYIKKHPLDKKDYAILSTNKKIKIIEPEQISSYELIAISAYTFSIFSILTLEAKHICNNSFFINYKADSDTALIDYNVFSRYVDVVTDREMLTKVLLGGIAARDQASFINCFNPTYPNTCKKLAEIVAG